MMNLIEPRNWREVYPSQSMAAQDGNLTSAVT
jgi:hypothetical protein